MEEDQATSWYFGKCSAHLSNKPVVPGEDYNELKASLVVDSVSICCMHSRLLPGYRA